MDLQLPITDGVLQFAALVAIAFLVQPAARRIRVPGLIGMLIAGMLIGPGGFGLLPREPVVEMLGSVGLVYLMFIAGLEVDLKILRHHRQETIAFGLLAFGLSIGPAIGAGLLLGFEFAAAVLLGTLLSSHTLVGYPVIERFRILHRKPMVTAIGGTLVTDTLALVLLVIVIQLAGDEQTGLAGLLFPLVSLAIIVALALWLVPRISRRFFAKSHASTAEKALYVLAVLMILAAVTELTGTEKILGAFLAGICLNRVLEERGSLREHIEFVGYMLFIPFFFISTGMLLELEVFTDLQVWTLAAILIGLVLVGKSSAAWITGAYYGYDWPARFTMIGLTVPQAAATLAVTMIARDLGLFPEALVDAVIILILVTCFGGILLTRWAARRMSDQHSEHGEDDAESDAGGAAKS